MAKRILCVIRTSTIRQEVESQHNDMIGFLLGKGYSEDEIEWLEAKGASARKVSKEYLSMLETIKATILASDTIKACAVWHLNRLGRVEHYITEMREWFTENHIQLYVKNPDITLLNPDGSYNTGNNIVFAVFASTIPAETEEMMEKFRRGKERNKALGKFIGGKVPFGFTIDKGYPVANEEQMKLVKLIYEEYATGKYSYYKLHDELLSRNLNFTIKHLSLLLRNERYIPYVGEDLWEKCKEVRNGNDWGLNTKESKYCHLGTKLIKCAKCGSTYITDTDIYICYMKKHGKKRHHKECKESVSIRCDVMDMILWDIASLQHRFYLLKIDGDSIEEFNKKNNVLKVKIAKLNDELVKCDDKVNRAKELYLEADITKAEYEKRKLAAIGESGRINADIKRMEAEVEQIEDSIKHLQNPDMAAQFSLMASVGDITKAEEMREIIRKHIDYVTLDTTEYNNRRCTLIIVVEKNGDEHKFIFDYNGSKKTKDMFDKLYRIRRDGTITKYSHTHKPMCQSATYGLIRNVDILQDKDRLNKNIEGIYVYIEEEGMTVVGLQHDNKS